MTKHHPLIFISSKDRILLTGKQRWKQLPFTYINSNFLKVWPQIWLNNSIVLEY
jgi:hypothetical protein